MKVIIIKKCKDGDINDVVNVKDGYGKNFLIKNGYAIAVNDKTMSVRNKSIANNQKEMKILEENALKWKSKIEAIILSFKLKTTNNLVHGSISRKQIINALKIKGIKIDAHAVQNVKINSIGISKINVKLSKDIMAILKVEVIDG